MPIPPLDDQGFLPQGVHDCSLEDVRVRFGSFDRSDRRPALLTRLEGFLAELRSVRFVESVVLDGSFVTSEPRPNDIDLILVVEAEHDFSADLPPFEYHALSKRRVQLRYGFDLLVARADSDEYRRYVGFFQQIRFAPGRAKGLLRIKL